MKNTLSENMMRFRTKNLSESAQKELIVKSIMETINQHGLHGAVRQRLTEALGEDPSWMTNAKTQLANEHDGWLAKGILKPGSTFTSTETVTMRDEYGKEKFTVIPKGTVWTPSPSATVAYASCKVYNRADFADLIKIMSNPAIIAQLAKGTYTENGKLLKSVESKCFWYPSTSSVGITTGGRFISGMTPDLGSAMRSKLLANASQGMVGQTGMPAPENQWKPKG